MKLTLVTAPAEEPITTAEAKLHLRVDHTADDTLIAALIVAARQTCETVLKRALVTQTWDLTLDDFPDLSYNSDYIRTDTIRLPLPPLQSITSITYTDDSGTNQTLTAGTDYTATTGTPGTVVPPYGDDWPDLTRGQPEAVTIRFVAGYGAADDVPQTIKQAMLLLVSHWYEHREAAIDPLVGNGPADLPYGVGALLAAESWGAYC